MWTILSIGAVAGEPVDLAEARRQCRIGPTDVAFDSELTRLIRVARDHLEGRCNVLLAARAITMVASDWSDLAALPIAALKSVTSLVYVDFDGEEQALGMGVYRVGGTRFCPAIVLKDEQAWPERQAGSDITLTAEFGSTPDAVQQAMLMLIAHWFANREATISGTIIAQVPDGVESLISNDKCYLPRVW